MTDMTIPITAVFDLARDEDFEAYRNGLMTGSLTRGSLVLSTGPAEVYLLLEPSKENRLWAGSGKPLSSVTVENIIRGEPYEAVVTVSPFKSAKNDVTYPHSIIWIRRCRSEEKPKSDYAYKEKLSLFGIF